MNNVVLKSAPNCLALLFDGFVSGYKSQQSIRCVKSNVSRFVDYVQSYRIENMVSLGAGDVTAWNVVLNKYMHDNQHRWASAQAYNTNLSNIKSFLVFSGMVSSGQLTHKHKKVHAYQSAQMLSNDVMLTVLYGLKATRNASRINYRDYVLLTALYVLGVRKNELINIRHQDIVYNGSGYDLRVYGKGNKLILKGVQASLYAYIAQLKTIENKCSEDYIFTGTVANKNVNYNKMSNKAINNILNRRIAQYTDISQSVKVHSIRALSGHQVYKHTNSVREAQQHLNHSSSRTTDIYLDKLDRTTTIHSCFERVL